MTLWFQLVLDDASLLLNLLFLEFLMTIDGVVDFPATGNNLLRKFTLEHQSSFLSALQENKIEFPEDFLDFEVLRPAALVCHPCR
jgi:hypothetical protein